MTSLCTRKAALVPPVVLVLVLFSSVPMLPLFSNPVGRFVRLFARESHSSRSGCRATHMAHVYDFYKPNLNSPYPTVDGQLSVQCFTSALDTCYTQYCTKSQMNHESHSQHPHAHSSTLTSREVNLSTFAAVLFHTPYVKLAQKSLARLYLNDLIRACPYIPSALAEKYK